MEKILSGIKCYLTSFSRYFPRNLGFFVQNYVSLTFTHVLTLFQSKQLNFKFSKVFLNLKIVISLFIYGIFWRLILEIKVFKVWYTNRTCWTFIWSHFIANIFISRQYLYCKYFIIFIYIYILHVTRHPWNRKGMIKFNFSYIITSFYLLVSVYCRKDFSEIFWQSII